MNLDSQAAAATAATAAAKRVLIMGSGYLPWQEAMVLAAGAESVFTLDYIDQVFL